MYIRSQQDRKSSPASPESDRTATLRFVAIGTHWQIDTERPLATAERRLVAQVIESFDLTYSRFRADSLVSQMARAPSGGRFEFPDDAVDLFDLCDRLVAATGGAIDPLVGRRLELLGYDASYSLVPASQRATRPRPNKAATEPFRAGTGGSPDNSRSLRPAGSDSGTAHRDGQPNSSTGRHTRRRSN